MANKKYLDENGLSTLWQLIKNKIPTNAEDVNAIASPSAPLDGDFLVYSSSASAWVAQTMSSWQGGSY